MQKLKWAIVFVTVFHWFTFHQSAQAQTPIPFRVGDKFGVTDEAGNFLIKPQFDWITICDLNQKILVGYKTKSDVVYSSLIYQNKILLADQYYRDYYLKNGLFLAVQFKIIDERNADFNKRFVTKQDLFTMDGRKLIDGNFSYITILNGIDEEGALDQTLVTTTDTAKRMSLFIYDRKSKTITKKLITNTNYLKLTNNAEVYYKNRSYTIIYRDGQGAGHQFQVVNDGKSLTLTPEKTVTITPEQPRGSDGVGHIDFPENTRPFRSDTDRVKDSVSRVINTYAIKRRYYFYPQTVEQLENTISLLQQPTIALITKNGKRGLKDQNTGLMLIPLAYDDICGGEFEGSGGYVLRNGKTYQAVYYDYKPVIIPTVFNKIPFALVDYFGKGKPLIKLYDQNGRFFCYANSAGKLYYQQK